MSETIYLDETKRKEVSLRQFDDLLIEDASYE